jgi:hypothetical protein
MKKGFLLSITISLIVYGGFGAADLSEAKDKLSLFNIIIYNYYSML